MALGALAENHMAGLGMEAGAATLDGCPGGCG